METPRIALASVMLAISLDAAAHVEYYDLNQGMQIQSLTPAGVAIAGNNIPLADPAYWSAAYQSGTGSGEQWTSLGGSYASGNWGYQLDVVNFDSSSWTDGTRTDDKGGAYLLGESHRVGLANFHLSRSSRVTITLSDDLGGTGYGLNPSFTLYRGSLVYQGHDGTVTDPLNPRTGIPSVKVQNARDTGTVTDLQGILSAYRNTLENTGTYYGQFNALGGWSMASEEGDWSAIAFIAAVTGYTNPSGDLSGNSNSSSLLGYLLPAGDYTIAFGGNAHPVSYASSRSGDATASTVTEMPATLRFQAIAEVPEPATWVSVLLGLLLLGRFARGRRVPSLG